MFFSVLILIVALIVHIALCIKFSAIAYEKGYDSSNYFWACFFLGMIGYVMVAALPDQRLHFILAELQKDPVTPAIKHKANVDPTERSAPPPKGNWACSCGRINANYVSSCSCGKSKRDAVK